MLSVLVFFGVLRLFFGVVLYIEKRCNFKLYQEEEKREDNVRLPNKKTEKTEKTERKRGNGVGR